MRGESEREAKPEGDEREIADGLGGHSAPSTVVYCMRSVLRTMSVWLPISSNSRVPVLLARATGAQAQADQPHRSGPWSYAAKSNSGQPLWPGGYNRAVLYISSAVHCTLHSTMRMEVHRYST